MSTHRVLFYSHDGFGLGHLRRNLNLASRLVRDMPDASALLLAGFPGVPGVELPEGVDLVKLPSVRKVATEQWRPRTLRVDDQRLREMRRALVNAAMRTFAPNLVVVDYMPGGVWGELVPSLETLHASGRARIVLGLRDILDAPEITRAAWARAGHGEILRRLYDRVLVYGQQEVFDADEAYGLSRFLPNRIDHVGYLCAGTSGADPRATRAGLGVAAGERLVVVTAGGGADAFPMMSLALAALKETTSTAPLRIVVIAGPLMRDEDFTALESAAAGTAIRVRRTVADLPDTLAAADLVVTMGAYNTLTEALRLGRRVLAIPRRGPSAEQGMRTRVFAERGLLEVAQDDESPKRVAARISALLDSASTPKAALDFSGLERASELLTSLLNGASARPSRRATTGARSKARDHAR